MTEQEERLYRLNLENFARRIAAKKMDLEGDRFGTTLPDDVWKQSIPEAERWMQFDVTQRSPGYAHVTVSGTCPPDATVKEVEDRFYHYYFGGRNAWVKDGRFGCTIHTD
jgi:hypothetical protein